jgi:hypothetical protein
MLIHFLNNAFAVLTIYYADRSEMLKKFADDNYSIPWYSALISVALSAAIIYFIKRKSGAVFSVAPVDEDKDYIA